MAWHPHPPPPGRHPLEPVYATHPPHGCICSWCYRERLGLWQLKFINAGCAVDGHWQMPAAHGVAA
jgi:hypothetical protein